MAISSRSSVPSGVFVDLWSFAKIVFFIAGVIHWPLTIWAWFERSDSRKSKWEVVITVAAMLSLLAGYLRLTASWWTASFEHSAAAQTVILLKTADINILLTPYYLASAGYLLFLGYCVMTDKNG